MHRLLRCQLVDVRCLILGSNFGFHCRQCWPNWLLFVTYFLFDEILILCCLRRHRAGRTYLGAILWQDLLGPLYLLLVLLLCLLILCGLLLLLGLGLGLGNIALQCKGLIGLLGLYCLVRCGLLDEHPLRPIRLSAPYDNRILCQQSRLLKPIAPSVGRHALHPWSCDLHLLSASVMDWSNDLCRRHWLGHLNTLL